jgi:flagellar motor switch protein FliN
MSEDQTIDKTQGAANPADPNWPRDMGARIERVGGATMEVTVELGRTRMPLEDVLQAEPGSVLETSKNAGLPLDILVNGALYGKGEAIVIGDNLAIRVTDLIAPNK